MKGLKDIAQATGFSIITVSRAVNNPEKLKPETRKCIQETMEMMDYVPNRAAKNLAAKRTGIIDVYIPEYIDINNPFMMHFIVGVSEVLSEYMYSFLIKRSWKKNHNCDGYLVTGLCTNEIEDFYARAQAQNLPVVLFGHTDIEGVDWFDVDNVKGAEDAINFLLENKHTKIAMINSGEDKDFTIDRFKGYTNALGRAGITPDPRFILKAPNTLIGGKNAIRRLLAEGDFSAVFCATDPLAVGAISGITESGLKVPGDISVIGFDGLGVQFLADPHITTIRQPVVETGRVLAGMLVDRINGSTRRVTGFMPPELLPGFSVAVKKTGLAKRRGTHVVSGRYNAEK
ncbi:MAG: LacI family transcriptional regulator [Treponema sp.]|nr:LacI family transcriptional regulator [Treponema sp.]